MTPSTSMPSGTALKHGVRIQKSSSKKPGTAGLVRRMTFGTTKDKMKAIVNVMDQGEAQMKAQDQAKTVTFMFESPNKEKASDYEMKLLNQDQEHIGIPETDYSVVIKMPSGEFQRVVRDLFQFDESVVTLCTKEGVKFPAAGEMQEPVTITFACRKLRDYEKENFEKMADDVKATSSHIVPRFQEHSIEKFSTTEDKMLTTEDCTYIKARPSIKSNEV